MEENLRNVPDSVWERTTLETLILADNGLIEVSEQLGRLQRLRTLDLGHNQLAALPESLGDLAELSDFLYLHDNRLATLPSSIAKLRKLRYLNISKNSTVRSLFLAGLERGRPINSALDVLSRTTFQERCGFSNYKFGHHACSQVACVLIFFLAPAFFTLSEARKARVEPFQPEWPRPLRRDLGLKT